MNKITEKQYENLRFYIEKNLINPILGSDYYNLGHDVYTSDKAITESIRDKFLEVESKKKLYFRLIIMYLVTNFFLLLVIAFLVTKI